MKHLFKISAGIVLTGLTATYSLMGGAFIGVATTRGNMSVDHADVRGNTNLADGASIETNNSVSQVRLQNGAKVLIGQSSVAAVHQDRLELKKGEAAVGGKTGYTVEVMGYQFTSEGEGGITQVMKESEKRVLVGAVDRPVRITSRSGVLVARLEPGKTYSVEQPPQEQGAEEAGRQNTPNTNNKKNSTSKIQNRKPFNPVLKPAILVGIIGGTTLSIGVAAGGWFSNDVSQ